MLLMDEKINRQLKKLRCLANNGNYDFCDSQSSVAESFGSGNSILDGSSPKRTEHCTTKGDDASSSRHSNTAIHNANCLKMILSMTESPRDDTHYQRNEPLKQQSYRQHPTTRKSALLVYESSTSSTRDGGSKCGSGGVVDSTAPSSSNKSRFVSMRSTDAGSTRDNVDAHPSSTTIDFLKKLNQQHPDKEKRLQQLLQKRQLKHAQQFSCSTAPNEIESDHNDSSQVSDKLVKPSNGKNSTKKSLKHRGEQEGDNYNHNHHDHHLYLCSKQNRIAGSIDSFPGLLTNSYASLLRTSSLYSEASISCASSASSSCSSSFASSTASSVPSFSPYRIASSSSTSSEVLSESSSNDKDDNDEDDDKNQNFVRCAESTARNTESHQRRGRQLVDSRRSAKRDEMTSPSRSGFFGRLRGRQISRRDRTYSANSNSPTRLRQRPSDSPPPSSLPKVSRDHSPTILRQGSTFSTGPEKSPCHFYEHQRPDNHRQEALYASTGENIPHITSTAMLASFRSAPATYHHPSDMPLYIEREEEIPSLESSYPWHPSNKSASHRHQYHNTMTGTIASLGSHFSTSSSENSENTVNSSHDDSGRSKTVKSVSFKQDRESREVVFIDDL